MSLSHISRFVLWGSIGFICGVGLVSFFVVSIDVILFIISTIGISSIFIFLRKTWLWCFVFFCLMFSMGAIIENNVLEKIHYIENNAGATEIGIATVIRDTVQKGWNTRVTFKYEDGTTVIIKDKKYTELVYGSVVNLKCKTSLPDMYNDFDYHKYLVMSGVDYICDNFTYEIIGYKPTVLSRLAQLRLHMESVIDNIISAPEAGLANGLLFGGNDRLSENLQDKFAKTGMTHIVAVSGYNVSIIVMVVMGLTIFMGVHRKYAVWFAIVSVIFFVAIIGFPSSGVRAAIMGVLVLIAAIYGRVSHVYGTIFFTAAIMLMLNPLLLRYDVGFQLSFLATLGIISVYPLIEGTFVQKKTAFGIVDVLLLTASAQLFVIPIIAYHFHTVSLVSLLANVLVLPIIPLTMLFVFLTVIASFVFYPVALFFGWMSYFLLQYEIGVVSSLAKISWGSMTVDNISTWWFVVYYIIVGAVVYLLNKYLYEI